MHSGSGFLLRFCCSQAGAGEAQNEAFECAERLSKGFPFVRVDLYIVGKKIYFGELTFTPSAGMDEERLKTTDLILGEMLKLPE